MQAAALPPTKLRERSAFYGRIDVHGPALLWEVQRSLAPPQWRSPVQASLCLSSELCERVMEAGLPITSEEAGGVEAMVDDQAWRLEESDVFVVGSRQTPQLWGDSDTVLFSFPDRPAQQAIGLWREARL